MSRTSDSGVSRAAAVLLAVGAGVWLAARTVRRRRHELRGRVVVLAGASRGLGLALARQVGARGARVALCARDPEDLARATADLEARGVEVMAVTCDLTHPEELAAFVAQVRERWGPIDVMVHNAGRITIGPAEHMTETDHRAAMDLHYWAPLRLFEAVLPEMRRRGRGHLVAVSSMAGVLPVPHMLPYTASKHALVGLAHGYRIELAQYGITVTTVMPGPVRTGASLRSEYKGRHRAEYTWFSLVENLPGSGSPVQKTARRIRQAIENGETDVVIGLPAQLGRLAYGLAPRLTQQVLAAATRMLPAPGGVGATARPGFESETALTRSPLMWFGRLAERRYNQLGDSPSPQVGSPQPRGRPGRAGPVRQGG